MKNNQNVIIAIVLSFLVIVGLAVSSSSARSSRRSGSGRRPSRRARRDAAPGHRDRHAGARHAGAPTPRRRRARQRRCPAPGRRGAPAPSCRAMRRSPRSQRVTIDTPSLKGSINLTGGRIDDLLLADYHVTVEPTSPLVELFSPVGSEHPYYADFGWVAAAGRTGRADRRHDLAAPKAARSRPGKDVTLTWDNGAGLVFKRTYSVDEKYMFTVRQSVENTTGAPVALYPYGARQPHRAAADRRLLHPARGPDRLSSARRACRRSTTASSTTRPSITPAKTPSRLARHHRQILGRGARSRPAAQPFQPRFLKGAAGARADLSGGFPRRRRHRPGRRRGGARDAALRRRQGDGALRRLPGRARASRASS